MIFRLLLSVASAQTAASGRAIASGWARLLLAPMAGWLAVCSVGAQTTDAATAGETAAEPARRATVEFQQPEQFVDFRSYTAGRDQGRPQMMAELRTYLDGLADFYLPPDQRLEITFTNIDLAGRLLPIRGSGQFQRLIEDFYPPRLWFNYRVVDENGAEISRGEAKLVDFSFLRLASRAMAHQTRRLPYEKALLDAWMAEHFGRPDDE